MKQTSFGIIAIAFTAAFPTSLSFAATATCAGQVFEVSNHAPGGVHVRVADSAS